MHLALPNNQDFLGSAHALLRLQDTYALSTEDLARGDVLGVSQTTPFSGKEGRVKWHTTESCH